jgi:ferredoxin
MQPNDCKRWANEKPGTSTVSLPGSFLDNNGETPASFGEVTHNDADLVGPLRIVIDPERCQGHARCVAVAPTLFDLDDDGYAVARQERVAGEDVQTLLRAVSWCPERAISGLPIQLSGGAQ